MRIVTASDAKMASFFQLQREACRELCYDPIVYDIDGLLGYGKRFDTPTEFVEKRTGKLPFKPRIIKDCLTKYGPPLAWLDADAIPIKRFEDVFDGTFDIAVTMRRADESRGKVAQTVMLYGFVNAGVIFFYPTRSTMGFLDTWIAEVAKTETHSDQEALNRIITQFAGVDSHGQVFNWNGVRFKILSTDEYNWYYWPEEPTETTKIVHCKTDKREEGLKWLQSKTISCLLDT